MHLYAQPHAPPAQPHASHPLPQRLTTRLLRRNRTSATSPIDTPPPMPTLRRRAPQRGKPWDRL
jgi:hypothetical protein